MRSNRQEMETKEFRAPHEGDPNPEPTPESVAQLREQSKASEDRSE
jgi:hypothetical protein